MYKVLITATCFGAGNAEADAAYMGRGAWSALPTGISTQVVDVGNTLEEAETAYRVIVVNLQYSAEDRDGVDYYVTRLYDLPDTVE